MAVHANAFETLVSCAKCMKDFQWECSSIAPVSSNFSSVSTQHFSLVLFLSSNDTVCLNLFIIIWIIFLFVTEISWYLCWYLLTHTATFHMGIMYQHPFF
jgi:hypothetical protein